MMYNSVWKFIRVRLWKNYYTFQQNFTHFIFILNKIFSGIWPPRSNFFVYHPNIHRSFFDYESPLPSWPSYVTRVLNCGKVVRIEPNGIQNLCSKSRSYFTQSPHVKPQFWSWGRSNIRTLKIDSTTSAMWKIIILDLRSNRYQKLI